MSQSLPEVYKIVQGLAPIAVGASQTGDYISVKDANRVAILIEHNHTNDYDITVGVNEATAVDASGAAAISKTMKVWTNTDTATSDTLTRQTDAATVTIDTGAEKNQQVVIELDPAILSSGFDCIAATLTGHASATSIDSITYFVDAKHKQDPPPAAITD